MEIITSFTALNLEPGNLPKEASQLRQGDFQSVLKALQDAYCNTASDPDAYLYETVAPENIIFGLYEPEKVLERLDAWNREIRVCDFFDLMHTTKETETPADLKNLRVFFVLRHHVLFPKQREIRKNIV